MKKTKYRKQYFNQIRLKLCTVFVVSFLLPVSVFSQSFITTWKTDNPGTSNNSSITIPTIGVGYNYDVDWDNDGIFDQVGITGTVTHDFLVTGTYTIRIQGAFPRIYFNGGGDRLKILSVDQWGGIQWGSMVSAFRGAENLVLSSTDAPDLSNVTEMNGMFREAVSLISGLSSWDVSTITDMSGLFFGAVNYNEDLTGWNVSNVTGMTSMFVNAHAFDGDVSNWDVSSVNSMLNLFTNAYTFNQDISNWDVSNVTIMRVMFANASSFNADISGWDISGVENTLMMFSGALAFNQDISSWDVSNVTDMSLMFNFATSFDQNIGDWDISSVATMNNMLSNSGLSIANYDSTLIGWEAQGVTNITLGANGLSYCASAGERTSLMTNHGWTIFGDANNCPILLSVELMEFDGTITYDQEVKLEWLALSTDSELVFDIQRSAAEEDWRSIGTAKAAESPDAVRYVYTDGDLPINSTTYYRLLLRSVDGTTNFSEVVSVHRDLTSVRVFPNPVQDVMHIEGIPAGTILVRNQMGAIVMTEKLTHSEANLSGLPAGCYYFTIKTLINTFSGRIIKQ